MNTKVCEVVRRMLQERKRTTPLIIGKYRGFIFLNRNGLPKVAVNYESMFRGLVKKYNKSHET